MQKSRSSRDERKKLIQTVRSIFWRSEPEEGRGGGGKKGKGRRRKDGGIGRTQKMGASRHQLKTALTQVFLLIKMANEGGTW